MSQSPHVLHLLDTDQFAGTERHIVMIFPELNRLGIATTLACRRDSPLHVEARQLGLQTVPVYGPSRPSGPSGPSRSWTVLKALAHLVRTERIDLVHTHNGRTMLMGALLHLLTGVRVVAAQHFIEPQHTNYRGLKRLIARSAHLWVNRQVTHFIATSEAARQAMIAREGVAPERITTVPAAIAPLEMPDADQRAAVRVALRVREDAPLIITLARLSPEKGLDILLRAVPTVLAACPRTRFALIGDGPQRVELERLAAELGLADAVQFTGFREDARVILGAADLLVLPSLAEPAGLALLEAMCLEKPVVATRAGGPLEIVREGETGLLVRPGDVAALAEGILTLLMSPELGRQYGHQGRERFLACYTAAEMARATAAVYTGIGV